MPDSRVLAQTAAPTLEPSVPLMVDAEGGVYLAAAHVDLLTRLEAKVDRLLKGAPHGG